MRNSLGVTMSRTLLWVGLIVILCPHLARAQEDKTEELVRQCEPVLVAEAAVLREDRREVFAENQYDIGYCTGFFAAILDANFISQLTLGESLFCLPNGISISQMVKIYVRFADDHPETLHDRIPITIAVALGQAFPCLE